jgi:metallo-beta-lactamase family protein
MHLTFLGATRAVTGSCTLLEHGTTRLLVDCGMRQGEGGGRQSDFAFDPASIDAVILTHGHLDHAGRVPQLVAGGFRGPVFGQDATLDIARAVWWDSLRIGVKSGQTDLTDEHVRQALRQAWPVCYQEEFSVGDLLVRLFDAGHILGSSHVLVEADGRRVLFSGDIGARGTPIIRDPFTAWGEPVDTVVIESTYGNRCHRGRQETVAEFAEIVTRTVERRGVLLIPAFAIGRTQEILFHCNSLIESRAIAPLGVFVDSPMANDITTVYRRYGDCYDARTRALIHSGDLPLEFPGLKPVEGHAESLLIENYRPPYIVVAGSGMCTGGRILRHLKTRLPHPETTVMIVGYQARGTTGRSLVDGADWVTIDGDRIPVRASIATLNGFSAHADKRRLLDWASHIPGKGIRWYVNHGEDEAVEALAEAIEQAGLGPAKVAEQGGSGEV